MKNIQYGTEFLDQLKDRVHDLYDENVKLKEEIKRLKEEYVILQNASDGVEEEKDKEIERLNNIINKAIKWFENADRRGLQDLLDILRGDKE